MDLQIEDRLHDEIITLVRLINESNKKEIKDLISNILYNTFSTLFLIKIKFKYFIK